MKEIIKEIWGMGTEVGNEKFSIFESTLLDMVMGCINERQTNIIPEIAANFPSALSIIYKTI